MTGLKTVQTQASVDKYIRGIKDETICTDWYKIKGMMEMRQNPPREISRTLILPR